MKKLFYMLILTGMFTSCMNPGTKDNSAANKEKVQQFYNDVINGHNPDALANYCSADFVDHNPDPGHSGQGMDDLKASFKDFFTGYPDIHATTKFMVAHGDTVLSYVTMTGTNSGQMANMPPTNKQVNVDGIDIVIIKDGKAVERYGIFDSMKMMEQLGMMGNMGAPQDASKMASQEDKKEEPKK
jgi:predicted ester cyclase